MLSARACNAQHASAAARRAGMRRSVGRELTLLVPIRVASARVAGAAQKIKRRPRNVAGPAQISSTQYAKISDAQWMLSVVVAARRRFIGSTTTLAPT